MHRFKVKFAWEEGGVHCFRNREWAGAKQKPR